ncbi:MAG: response regulator [Desulfobacterales bacterium]|nr:response regulator [Desulfobacterales bacterium]
MTDAFGQSVILIADDLRINRNMLKILCRDTDMKFIEAENGEEAVSLARKHMPDIILMDIMMPVMDGCESAKLIKADDMLENIPVIALTGMEDNMKKFMQAGFDGYLIKPVRQAELFKLLRNYITP